ncbi:MAG: flavin-dependent oxidoreductase [Lautropia sp.]
MNEAVEVAIVGAGVGGLTLALALHEAGIGCRVYEAVPRLEPLGVGINLLPHAVAQLARLGLLDALARVAVTTRHAAFYNRHGQFVYREPLGRDAGHAMPQFSIHRGDLQDVLLSAVRARLGEDAVRESHRCTGFEQDDDGVAIAFQDPHGAACEPVRARVLVGCDGIHSVVRKALHPHEGPPRYSGVNMWRGTVAWPPFLDGATMVRAGWLSVGKMVVYPIREAIDAAGRQLVNWVAEIERPQPAKRDWSNRGRLEDFHPVFADWRFDWLDVSEMIERTPLILEYPMVDQDPLPRWSFGRATLLGDAAHPMVPRGSNGAGQSILDVPCLVEQLQRHGLTAQALSRYDAIRRPATAQVVLANRTMPPDAILQRVHELTGGERFGHIDDVIGRDELARISDAYKVVSGLRKAD